LTRQIGEILMIEKSAVTMTGTVEKIIPSIHPRGPEKAQIGVDGADGLYREIRIANTLTDKDGDEVRLRQGAHVDVTIEIQENTTAKKES
jgi:hypothetical protein